jgi:hypothetical protein
MRERDDRIDFLRGIALIAMFIDHVHASPLSLLTLRSFAFFDAAELFFFLSGMAAAIVYLPVLRNAGPAVALVRVFRRAWQLYAAQMVLLVFVAAEVAFVVAMTGNHDYFGGFRIRHFFDQTDSTILPALLLRYQPAYLDILPVYVVLFLALPLILYGLSRNVWTVLAASLALYLAVQIEGWTFRSYPWNASWQFNPLAWQFIFVAGAACASLDGLTRRISRQWLFVAAATVATASAAAQLSIAFNPYLPVVPAFGEWVPIASKSDLGWLRLVSFFSLAIVTVGVMPQGGWLTRRKASAAIIACGRHSLAVFCLSVLLAVAAQILWDTTRSTAMQASVNLAGIAIMLAFARLLDWMRAAERVPAAAQLSAASA